MIFGTLALTGRGKRRTSGGHFVPVRLDRALVSADWSAEFPLASLRHLTAAKSGHRPILPSLYPDERRQPCRALGKPFRYEMMWETNKDFPHLIEQVWKDGAHCTTVKDIQEK